MPRSFQYEIKATLVESDGKAQAAPFAVTTGGQTVFEDVEFFRLEIDPAGTLDPNEATSRPLKIQLGNPETYEIKNPDNVVFLAVFARDKPSMRENVIAYSLEAAQGAIADTPTREEVPNPKPGAGEPDKVWRDRTTNQVVDEIRRKAASANLLVLPEGGDIYAGPAVRWLVKAMITPAKDGKKAASTLYFWSLSDKAQAVDILIGRKLVVPQAEGGA